MQIVFLRHAQPAWIVDGHGRPDPGLTAQGREQATRAAARLAGEGPFDVFWTSNAARNIETSAHVTAANGQEPEVVPGLVEIGLPDFEGVPSVEVERSFREAYGRPPDEWWDGHPGGETFRDFHNRVTTTLVDLLSSRGVTPHGGHLGGHLWDLSGSTERILIVGHGGTNAVAIGFLLGLDPTPWEWERFVLGHASIARLGTFALGGAHVFSMRSFNDQEHLPDELRSR
jgi:probable phosphoglycerate mutase